MKKYKTEEMEIDLSDIWEFKGALITLPLTKIIRDETLTQEHWQVIIDNCAPYIEKYLYQYQKLTDEFIIKNKKKISWTELVWHQKLSENILRKFKEELDWEGVSKKQNLSDKFMKEFEQELDWNNISKYQKLSEEFMKEYKDWLDWSYISQFQNFSKKFANEMIEYIDIESLKMNKKIDWEFEVKVKFI